MEISDEFRQGGKINLCEIGHFSGIQSVYHYLRCIFRPVQRLSSFFFRFKDRIPFGLRSRVVY